MNFLILVLTCTITSSAFGASEPVEEMPFLQSCVEPMNRISNINVAGTYASRIHKQTKLALEKLDYYRGKVRLGGDETFTFSLQLKNEISPEVYRKWLREAGLANSVAIVDINYPANILRIRATVTNFIAMLVAQINSNNALINNLAFYAGDTPVHKHVNDSQTQVSALEVERNGGKIREDLGLIR